MSATFGALLVARMDGRGWGYAELARRAGIAKSHAWGIARGRVDPSLRVVEQLAAAFGVSVTSLLAGCDDGHDWVRRCRVCGEEAEL